MTPGIFKCTFCRLLEGAMIVLFYPVDYWILKLHISWNYSKVLKTCRLKGLSPLNYWCFQELKYILCQTISEETFNALENSSPADWSISRYSWGPFLRDKVLILFTYRGSQNFKQWFKLLLGAMYNWISKSSESRSYVKICYQSSGKGHRNFRLRAPSLFPKMSLVSNAPVESSILQHSTATLAETRQGIMEM